MGYSTEFSGSIAIKPPLDAEHTHRANDFAEDGDGPSIHCDWRVTQDGAAIEWDGTEKTYESERWIQAIIDEFVIPAGSVANGEILANGEETGDVWFLVVENNQVHREEAKVVRADRLPPVPEPVEFTATYQVYATVTYRDGVAVSVSVDPNVDVDFMVDVSLGDRAFLIDSDVVVVGEETESDSGIYLRHTDLMKLEAVARKADHGDATWSIRDIVNS